MNDFRRFITIIERYLFEAQGAIRDLDVWGDNYRILKNPNKREMADMARYYHDLLANKEINPKDDVSEDQHVRTLHDTRDTYAWGALHNTHDYVADVLGLSDFSKGHVNYDPKTNTSEFHHYEGAPESWSYRHSEKGSI